MQAEEQTSAAFAAPGISAAEETLASSIPSGHTHSSIERALCRSLKRCHTMKRLCATMAIFLLSGGLALAQTNRGGTGPSTGSSTTSPPNPTMAPARNVGLAPGANSGNSQDLTNRSNPQDLTRPGGTNPQDLRR
jgi:hypothetical protein